MLEFIPWIPASCDSRLRAWSRGAAEPGQHWRSEDLNKWLLPQMYLSACIWFSDLQLSMCSCRCRPVCDHSLWGPVCTIHHQKGHPESRVYNKRNFLQEEAQKALNSGGKMASLCSLWLYSICLSIQTVISLWCNPLIVNHLWNWTRIRLIWSWMSIDYFT